MTSNGHVAEEELPIAVGRIGCPVGQEANVDEFFFWVAPGELVEQTQIVRVPTVMGGQDVEVFGVVEQVYRRSTISSMHMELAAHDGDPIADDLMLDRDGVTYAKARVVNAFPPNSRRRSKGSTVFSCGEHDAERAYEIDTYADDRGVCIGLIRNGRRLDRRAGVPRPGLLARRAVGASQREWRGGVGHEVVVPDAGGVADDQRREDRGRGHGRAAASARRSRRSSST